MSLSAVEKWLKFLDKEEYSDSFIDNGYDDLETLKLIEKEDLEAIGVMKKDHQDYLLAAVKVLKEKGAAWVYLLYTETTEEESDNCLSYKYDLGSGSSKYWSGSSTQESYKYGSGSSGLESFRSSIYHKSDDALSEESQTEDKPLQKNIHSDLHSGLLIKKFSEVLVEL